MGTTLPEQEPSRSGRAGWIPSQDTPDWSIIVPVYNEATRLGNTLRSIETFTSEFEFEPFSCHVR